MSLVSKIASRTDSELAAGLARAQRLANEVGITTIFNATTAEPGLRAFAAAEREGHSRFESSRP